MNTFSKRVGLILLCLTISMGLFANGGQEGNGTDGPVKLTYWHLWGGSRAELIDQLVARFNETHPNIEIEATFTPSNELMTKVLQAAGTGTLPDIVQIWSGWYGNMDPANTLVNLDKLLDRDNINLEEILVAAEAQRSYWEGSVYSLPNVNAGAQGLLFYNKGLLREAGLDPEKDLPSNWAEFQELSRILVDKLNDGNQLEVIAWDPNQMAGQTAVQVFSYGAGYKTVSDDGKTSLINTPGVLKTMKAFDDYIMDIYGDYGDYRGVLEWNSRVAGADTGTAQVQAFIKEKQAFYVSGSWTIGQVQSANPDLELGIIPLPGFNGPHGGTAQSGWSYAISKDSKNIDAAWEFLKFITIAVEGNGEFCIAQGRPSPIVEVNNDPAYLELGPLWTNLVNSMKLDIVPVSADIHMDVVKPWFRDVPSRRINGESVEDILKDIDSRYQDYLDDIN
jgi:ABC-type glycerol-3-phosphate transport system substrate-binding protein